jgi:hypothetical protein
MTDEIHDTLSKEEENKANENIRKIIECCKDITLRLTKLSDDKKSIAGVASGFIVENNDEEYLISAGHALKRGKWVIETDLVIENKGVTACIPINCPWTTKRFTLGKSNPENIDFAWAKIDLNAFKKAIQKEAGLKGKTYTFSIYRGPLNDEPDMQLPHSYASLNQATIIDAIGPKILERVLSYDYEMFYKGFKNDKGLYVFSIPNHKGHDYYRGASGSPIIDPSGKIVSILLGGCETKNELYGLPLADFTKLISISRDAE